VGGRGGKVGGEEERKRGREGAIVP